ncbi:MAG TPA: hypothetical protein VH540_08465 [Ktedonobacterales bacterium]|jgi:hypothetical protein
MDNTSWDIFEPQARKILLSTLRLLTSSVSTLTVLLLVCDGRAEGASEAVEKNMQAVEQVLRSDLRRSDVVLHCGRGCCAALLIGADSAGACCVVRRLHRELRERGGVTLSFSLGWAATGEPGHEVEALVAFALEGRRAFLPVADEALFVPGAARKMPASRGARLRQVFDTQVLTAAMQQERARKKRNFQACVEPPERPVVIKARARARELGVPYLSPPQHIPLSVRRLVPLEVMQQYRCLPVGRNRNALTVALADPTDTGALLCLEQVTGLTIFPVMTDPEVLEHLTRLPRGHHP